MTDREIILQCAQTNQKYMHLRVGKAGFPRVVELYRRLAEASVALAEEYSSGAEHPSPHEPAVDAFWWALVGWSSRFMGDVLNRSPSAAFEMGEMMGRFHLPHLEFAMWLRPLGVVPLYPPTPSMQSASGLILCHDSFWTSQVIRLTARWGLWQHVKDVPALIETRRLLWRLRRYLYDPVALAYVESDIMFLVELFEHFDFPPEGKDLLRRFLDVAIDETENWGQQAQVAP